MLIQHNVPAQVTYAFHVAFWFTFVSKRTHAIVNIGIYIHYKGISFNREQNMAWMGAPTWGLHGT